MARPQTRRLPALPLRLALAGIAAAGCRGPSATLAPPLIEDGQRAIVVLDRTGGPLWLSRAVRDGWAADEPLPRSPRLALRLPPGRYAVRLGRGGPRVPLPLPPGQPGSAAPPEETRLTVLPWPPPDPGWCWIPPGPALRGDELGVGQEDERPLAAPSTAGFWLARCETTNAQYAQFLDALGREAVDPGWLDLGGPMCRVRWDPDRGGFATDAPDLPVVTVSFAGAVAYCEWRTAATGVVHRLPSETEWEKAARGPGSRVYAYGDTFRTDAANQESGRLAAVGSFAPNAFGLFDMTGNAFEWTGDLYRREAGNGADPAGPSGHRSLRGGSFVLDGIFVRNSMRMHLRPEVRADDVGFRVLREAVPADFDGGP